MVIMSIDMIIVIVSRRLGASTGAQAALRWRALSAASGRSLRRALPRSAGNRYTRPEHFVHSSSGSADGANTKQRFSNDNRVDHPVSLYAAIEQAREGRLHLHSFVRTLAVRPSLLQRLLSLRLMRFIEVPSATLEREPTTNRLPMPPGDVHSTYAGDDVRGEPRVMGCYRRCRAA
jgi:hypothetical protein